MSTTAAKKVRQGPAVMTLDMYGRLKVNQALAFDIPRLRKRAEAMVELRKAIGLQKNKAK